MPGAQARPHRPVAQRDGRQAPSRAATPSERIASYYDQADQPIADYLAGLGWAKERPAPRVREQAQIRVLPHSPKKAPQSPEKARPAP